MGMKQALALGLAFIACTEPSTPPAPEPIEGRIAFVSTREGGATIYVAEGAGTVRRLTAGEYPAWSAAGTRIAFQRDNHIYTINDDGSDERDLGSGLTPAWSPDSEWIAFSSANLGGGILIVRADGTGPERVLIPGDLALYDWVGSPGFSPDGRRLLFVRYIYWEDVSTTWLVNVDGSSPHSLSTNGLPAINPSWSPDGTSIAVEARNNIATTSPDQGGFHVRFSDQWHASDPDWSPDGGSLVFTKARPGACDPPDCQTRIFVGSLATGRERQVIADLAPGSRRYSDYHPAWSRVLP